MTSWILAICEVLFGLLIAFNGCFIGSFLSLWPLILILYHIVALFSQHITKLDMPFWLEFCLVLYILVLAGMTIAGRERAKYFFYIFFLFSFVSLMPLTFTRFRANAILRMALLAIAFYFSILSSWVLETRWKKRGREKIAMLTIFTGSLLVTLGASRAFYDDDSIDWPIVIYLRDESKPTALMVGLLCSIFPTTALIGFGIQFYKIDRDRKLGLPPL